MPNLSDIVEVAEALETKPVLVVENRCVVVRNRNAKCTKCIDACPTEVIHIADNHITFDYRACVACGACTVVCPTESLIPVKPLDHDLATTLGQACIEADGTALIGCARIASKREGNPDMFAEVPCLARVEESLLMNVAAQGIEHMLLVDGTCKTCKYRACDPGITETVYSTNTLLEAVGSAARVERTSEFPEAFKAEHAVGSYGLSRRGFFTRAKDVAKGTAEKAATSAFKSVLNEKAPTLRDMLKVEEDTLPQFEAERRMNILDAMDSLGQPVVSEIDTRLWGSVEIETDLCNSCNMCTIFCPTGALRKSDIETDDKTSYLEFSTADCVQCMVCEDICLKSCVKVHSVVPMADLFDFEPRLFHLPEPPYAGGILSRFKK